MSDGHGGTGLPPPIQGGGVIIIIIIIVYLLSMADFCTDV